MTGKTAQSYYILTTATFQAYRRLTVKCVRSRNVPQTLMLTRACVLETYVRTVHHIYIQVKKKAFKINAKIEDVGLNED